MKHIQKTALAITRWVGSPASLIVHTALFLASFLAVYFNRVAFEQMLLILTTIVSLEAIYLSLLIQMTINYTTESIEEVSEDIEEMQEDIGELQEDVEEISEDVGEMSEVEEADEQHEVAQQKTLSTIQADLRKLIEDIEKLQRDQPPRTSASL